VDDTTARVTLSLRVAGHRVTMYRTGTGIDTRIDGVSMTPPARPV
jgi:hypothetical protein